MDSVKDVFDNIIKSKDCKIEPHVHGWYDLSDGKESVRFVVNYPPNNVTEAGLIHDRLGREPLDIATAKEMREVIIKKIS